MNYKLLYGIGAQALNEKVTDHLNDGWKLYGYPFTEIRDDGSIIVYQAVILRNRGAVE